MSDSSDSTVLLAVCGAHLEGLPLNYQLTERGAQFVRGDTTAPKYRFFALAGGPPFRPGLIRVNAGESGGASIAVELWAMPVGRLGDFVAAIPQPLGIGKVELANGDWVCSFICEGYAARESGAEEITHLGSWHAYLAAKNA